MPQELEPEPTTTATASPESAVAVTEDLGPDPDLNDDGSEAYTAAMGESSTPAATETPPTPDEPPAPPEAQAEPVETLWKREGSRFVKYEPPKKEPPKIEPWKANIYGKEVEAIPGVLKDEAGNLFIPAARVGDLSRALAHASKYPEVQVARQERARDRAEFAERETFQGQKYSEVLEQTLLNPEWVQWAASSDENYRTAQREVRVMLQQAQVELSQKFGALPTPTEAPAEGEPLDRYEAESGVGTLLDELLASSDYHGVLTAADKQAILTQLHDQDVPLFFHHPEQGWLLDERPVRMAAAMRAELVKAGRTTKPPTGAGDAAARRNAAAVPTPTAVAPAPPPPPKPKTETDPYADHPWDNPKLDFQERRRLFHAAKGFGMPGG